MALLVPISSESIVGNVQSRFLYLPITNGEHCTGDGIEMCTPQALVKPDDPDAKPKILATEALRGVGGLAFKAHRLGEATLSCCEVENFSAEESAELAVSSSTHTETVLPMCREGGTT